MVLSNFARAFTAECRFYFDDEVRDQIFGLIRGARTSLYLVSPYNRHSQQLKERLTEAIIEREVSVTMLYRDEKDQREGVTYLEDLGATVLPVEWLHSKIYMNESTALASSMNLLDSSFNNSSEFCIRIDRASNRGLFDQLADYVERIQSRAVRAVSWTGHCVRCSEEIALDLEMPFCAAHYKSWNRYKKSNYVEKYCHLCGEKSDTSMAKPLCRSCWQDVVQA